LDNETRFRRTAACVAGCPSDQFIGTIVSGHEFSGHRTLEVQDLGRGRLQGPSEVVCSVPISSEHAAVTVENQRRCMTESNGVRQLFDRIEVSP
jgi:hypothetical protein